MNPLYYFFIIYVLTIVIARIFLWFYPVHWPKIGKYQPHHFLHGLILIIVYFLTSKVALLAVGVALVVDELPLFFMTRGFSWKHYHSKTSIISVAIISVIGYLVSRYILF